MVRNIGIINCESIQDTSCIGCAKCYKATRERVFAFEGDDEIQVIFKTGYGGCPGLVLPKLALQKLVISDQGDSVDRIYFGTCVKKAKAVMSCPMNLDGIAPKLEEMFGVPVEVGTHDY